MAQMRRPCNFYWGAYILTAGCGMSVPGRFRQTVAAYASAVRGISEPFAEKVTADELQQVVKRRKEVTVRAAASHDRSSSGPSQPL